MELSDVLGITETQPKGARVEGLVTTKQGEALQRLATRLAGITGGNAGQTRSKALRVALEAGLRALEDCGALPPVPGGGTRP